MINDKNRLLIIFLLSSFRNEMNLECGRPTNFYIKLLLQRRGLCTKLRLIIRNIFVFSVLGRGSVNNPLPIKSKCRKK